MAIYGLNKDITTIITDKENESLVPLFDSERVNTELLVTLPGSSWEVTYFHRKLTEESLVVQYDPTLDVTLQELIRINDFVIKVDTPLPAGLADDVVGSGIIDVTFIPTANDVFIVKLMDGRSGIFVITNVARFNYNQEKVFKVEYKLYQAPSTIDDPVLIAILNATTETFTFNKDFRLNLSQPLYSEDDIVNRENVSKYIDKLLSQFSSMFITTDTNYFIGFKDNLDTYFDLHIENFVREVIGITNLNNKLELVDINSENLSILDYTINTDNLTNRIFRYNKIDNSNVLNNNPYLFALSVNNINKVIDVTDFDDSLIPIDNEIINTLFPKINTKNYIFRDYVYSVVNGEPINNVVTNLTKFEILYLNMITGNVISVSDIVEVYNEIYMLPKKEQFYFIPILIYIIKYYLITFTVKYI